VVESSKRQTEGLREFDVERDLLAAFKGAQFCLKSAAKGNIA
jgi:hypothetical protein